MSMRSETTAQDSAPSAAGGLPATTKHEKQEKAGSTRVRDVEADEDLRNLDPVEQKMVLVNRAINSQGMGRYQWCLFCLTGFGYFLDLAFAQLFGLIITPLGVELGVADEDLGNLSSSFNAGLCAGAFMWGILIDVVGRRWAFNISLFVSAFFGLFLGVPDSFGAICGLAALCGLGLGGNIPIDATIMLEFLPARNRWLLVVLSIFQPLGVLFCSLITWALIPSNSCNIDLCQSPGAPANCCPKSENMGWRYSCYTVGSITLGLFFIRFFLFNFRESPKFLIVKGRDQQAIDVVHSIAKFNKCENSSLHLTIEDFQHLEAIRSQISTADSQQELVTAKPKKWYNLTQFKTLFSTKKAIGLTLLIWAIYLIDYWSFSLAGSFLPIILQRKGAAADISTYETYRNYIIQAVVGLPGVALGASLVEIRVLAQRWSMAITASLQGVSLFLFAVIDSQAGNVAFNSLEYFFQSAFNSILYGVAPLYFHTSVRGIGVGSASTLGRLISIVSPKIGSHILANTGTNDVLYVAGAPMFAVALLSLLLPNVGKKHVF